MVRWRQVSRFLERWCVCSSVVVCNGAREEEKWRIWTWPLLLFHLCIIQSVKFRQ